MRNKLDIKSKGGEASMNTVKTADQVIDKLPKLFDDIASDYRNFVHNGLGVKKDDPKFDEYVSKFRNGLKFEQGKKYLKIIKTDSNQPTVWGFINLWNTKFQFGDILFPAGWKTPALNKARGNVFGVYVAPWTSAISLNYYR